MVKCTNYEARFEVFTAVKIEFVVFWFAMPWWLDITFQRTVLPPSSTFHNHTKQQVSLWFYIF